MRSSGYIASLVAAGAIPVPHNGNLQNDNKHYEIVTKFEYVTHYVIRGRRDVPQTTCVSQPKTSNFEQQPDISREYITTAIYAQPINVQPVKRPKQAPNRHPISGFGPSCGLATDQQEAVNLQNNARKAVGNGPLSWDDTLAAGAQQWANHLAPIGFLQHSKGNHG
ncbi:Pathogenesis-related protein 1A [Fusarium oxysporum f. sp. rapae]|uniref:Pathogenesis-related protein 1A n=1 Tax=Fusarium oxysporum f. sp. rapae TaxID=485398 RepID=A0A8J5U2V7_FUSOX|nr:Pathogenesis-related protein 1A [Fusarium oxysporum f. sp. rapae]